MLIILLPAVAPMHQSGEYVFTTFNSDTSASGVPSSGCGACLVLPVGGHPRTCPGIWSEDNTVAMLTVPLMCWKLYKQLTRDVV